MFYFIFKSTQPTHTGGGNPRKSDCQNSVPGKNRAGVCFEAFSLFVAFRRKANQKSLRNSLKTTYLAVNKCMNAVSQQKKSRCTSQKEKNPTCDKLKRSVRHQFPASLSRQRDPERLLLC